ncbi:SIMPL domain-containing protein [Candidatus Uhrbacteria bacterium]|nr:SIMPL domain-containing protein [Candidatus Uhrbacteria bacterium]
MNQSNASVVLNRTVILTVSILSLALVASVGFAAWGFVESKKPTDQASATFTGKAERQIESDTAKWTVTLSRTASSTEEALKSLESDRESLKKLVAKFGVTDAIYSFQTVRTQGPYHDRYENYDEPASAFQSVTVESKMAGALGEVNQRAGSELRMPGFSLSGERIEFSYSKMTELEQELTKTAAENARKQAESMLGNQLGKLRSLDRPQLAVRSANSADSYYAQNDITSFKKTVVVTIVASYRIK